MKRTNIPLALSLAALLTSQASASLTTFNWVQAPDQSSVTSSGNVVYDPATQSVTSLFFTAQSGTTTVTATGFSPATLVLILGDGNLQLQQGGVSSAGTWFPNAVSGNAEQVFLGAGFPVVGDWVPVSVPESATTVVGWLLLLPLGVSVWRKSRHLQQV